MGRAFLAALLGFPLAIGLAVASVELASSEPSLATRLMEAAIAVAVVIAGMLLLTWRRDSRTIAADGGTAPADSTLAFEDGEDTPPRSRYAHVDTERDILGTAAVIAAAPAASLVERLEAYDTPDVVLEGHAHVLDFAPESATDPADEKHHAILRHLRRAERAREEVSHGVLDIRQAMPPDRSSQAS